MTTTAHTTAALAALRDARTDIEDLVDHVQNRINTLDLDGEPLTYEEGRLDGARNAATRINQLIEELEMGRHELGSRH